MNTKIDNYLRILATTGMLLTCHSVTINYRATCVILTGQGWEWGAHYEPESREPGPFHSESWLVFLNDDEDPCTWFPEDDISGLLDHLRRFANEKNREAGLVKNSTEQSTQSLIRRFSEARDDLIRAHICPACMANGSLALASRGLVLFCYAEDRGISAAARDIDLWKEGCRDEPEEQ